MTDPLDQPEDEGYDLLYPFICVTSKGGPYDDDTFVAGVSVGMIDQALATARSCGADRYRTTVRTNLLKQLELVGMARGFPVVLTEEVGETEGHPAMPEWSFITFLTEADDRD
ncbi:hypothetical protein Drose_04340 [Dactylosporangium roseum]|uniref:Uncharacterized protein n=1 Tax=Dactylosporangium roseum TaxID=47989 RepID=A0ABY5Z788_9ACTN|nr:hypothetical protein [Dactylosporangium roseum]UWZ37519.1 hypothetical protein Drose_04340 [Dactylosporangium roseum]